MVNCEHCGVDEDRLRRDHFAMICRNANLRRELQRVRNILIRTNQYPVDVERIDRLIVENNVEE